MQAAVRCRWHRPMLHAYAFAVLFRNELNNLTNVHKQNIFRIRTHGGKKPAISNTDRFLCFNGTISYTYFIYFRWFQFSCSDINWDVRWYLNSWIWLDTSHVISAFGCELNFVVCMNQRKPRKLVLKKTRFPRTSDMLSIFLHLDDYIVSKLQTF